jgi:phage tail sheath protein FI
MALRLASPGINVREVDLTRGGIQNTSSLAAGIAAPFAKGPVNQIVTIRNEDELKKVFGGPSPNNYHYEYWYSASNFLSYGGSLKVVRCNGDLLRNASAGAGSTTAAESLNIENYDDYQDSQANPTTWYFAAKNPGYWAEELKVCVIDHLADQTLSGINTTGLTVGMGVTQALTGTIAGVGTTSAASGFLKGVITGFGSSEAYVRVTSKVVSGTETAQDYTEYGTYSFRAAALNVVTSAGVTTLTPTPTAVADWYNTQNILDIDRGDSVTVSWRSIAPKPTANAYVTERGGGNDAMHVVVIDSRKTTNISGTPQTILEKFVNLSKATDTTVSPSTKIYYRDYIALNSAYIYAGKSPGITTDVTWGLDPVSVKFSSGFTLQSESLGDWGTVAENRTFNSIGNKSFTLYGGKDYNGLAGGFEASLTNLITAYDKFNNDAEVSINYLLQGSASGGKELEQAKAKTLISIADSRKDCVAFISPYRQGVVNVADSATQLENVLSFFSPLTSSSYAVFDSGYQYVYDRFNQQFVYMPCSADVAGLCVRTDINQFPWYSPAGKSRGSLKFAIKLAYNPAQADRDQLYSQRVNPIISSPGSGIILFGDKTALAYQSAFDRINVRRLFITIEQAIKGAADAQLFEFNDAATRANFINIVEPYLRDVQVKRGITDFLLVCDESNNTPDVIDRNEFVADIFVKPARSINFIGLTFVATRTGVSFETVVGTV